MLGRIITRRDVTPRRLYETGGGAAGITRFVYELVAELSPVSI
jgi:hypothetical protein